MKELEEYGYPMLLTMSKQGGVYFVSYFFSRTAPFSSFCLLLCFRPPRIYEEKKIKQANKNLKFPLSFHCFQPKNPYFLQFFGSFSGNEVFFHFLHVKTRASLPNLMATTPLLIVSKLILFEYILINLLYIYILFYHESNYSMQDIFSFSIFYFKR